VIVEVSTYEEDVAVFWRGLLQRFIQATAGRMQAEQAAGNAPAGDPAATAFALVWMCERTLYQQVVQQDPVSTEQLAQTLESIWMRAIYGRD